MLSILIPTYNTNVDALTTEIHRQCERLPYPFEILLLDDASTDQAIQKQHPRLSKLSNCSYHQNPENLGRTATRQKLAQMASYSWLLFLDADVQPKYQDFLERFELHNQPEFDIIFGGISYRDHTPHLEEILRWKYGKNREAKSVIERLKAPHFIISQNLLIKKEVFLTVNSAGENKYGLDNFVSYQILKHGFNIHHIDNPVFHLGLETTDTFLKKSIDSLKTTLYFMRKEDLPENFRPVQKAYLKLKRVRMLGVFKAIMRPSLKKIERNLRSLNPNLTYFDMYRLYHYALLKEQDHA